MSDRLNAIYGAWSGTFLQSSHGVSGKYTMELRIEPARERAQTEGVFGGELHWPTLQDSRPAIKGTMNGDTLRWTEAIPQEGGRVRPGRYDVGMKKPLTNGVYVGGGAYVARLLEDGTLDGVWYEPGKEEGDEDGVGGTFRLHRDS